MGSEKENKIKAGDDGVTDKYKEKKRKGNMAAAAEPKKKVGIRKKMLNMKKEKWMKKIILQREKRKEADTRKVRLCRNYATKKIILGKKKSLWKRINGTKVVTKKKTDTRRRMKNRVVRNINRMVMTKSHPN